MRQILFSCLVILIPGICWSAAPALPSIPAVPTITSSGTERCVNWDGGVDAADCGASCTGTAACDTIDYAIGLSSAGDIITVKAGTYTEYARFDVTGGDATHWTTMRAATGEEVTIAGGAGAALSIIDGADYMYVKGINMTTASASHVAKIWNGSNYVVIEDVDIDGGSAVGFPIGDTVGRDVNADYVWMNNVTAHGSGGSGFQIVTRSSNITFVGCTAYDNGDDGFGSHLAGPGETYEDCGPPVIDADDVSTNVYYDRCIAHDNVDNGFDVALVKGENVYRNCLAYGNGAGIKVWGQDVWIHGCQTYDNEGHGIDIKPVWADSTYVITNSLSEDNAQVYSYGAELHVSCDNCTGEDTYTLQTANLYMYNTILQASVTYCMKAYGTNLSIQEEDYNYYYSDAASTTNYGFEDRSSCGGAVNDTYSAAEMSDGTWYAATGFGEHNLGVINNGGDPGFTNPAVDRRDDPDRAQACGTLPTTGSGTLGQMVLLLIPVAHILLMKTLRRRKN